MKLFARINLSSVALRRGILVSTFALAVAAICGCRESDVVIYDGDPDNIVWGSIGTDSTWREAFAGVVDPKNECFHTLQKLKPANGKEDGLYVLREYDFSGVLRWERKLEGYLQVHPSGFIVSGGGLYLWHNVIVEVDVKPPEIINGTERRYVMTDTDHEEFRRYDLKTGRYSIVRFGEKDWGNESTSLHFAYCNNGIVVLARHGPYVRTDPNGVPCPPPRGIRRRKDDAGGVFRVGHDGVVTKIISEQDHRASRLELVPGWSAAYFAVKTVNGDVRIYDMDCKLVHHVRLSKTHPDFVADDLFVTYVWADDETIVCKNTITEGKYGMLAISAKTGEVREAKASEFKEAWRSGVRLRGPLRIKERF
jgi:hypothetical protein